MVVIVAVMVSVMVTMVMAVVVAVRMAAEDQRAAEVDQQPERGHAHRLAIVDGLRREQPLDRARRHQRGNA